MTAGLKAIWSDDEHEERGWWKPFATWPWLRGTDAEAGVTEFAIALIG